MGDYNPKRLQRSIQKGQMARQLVYYCIFVLSVTDLWEAIIKTNNQNADLSDILTFIGAAFGGELLLLAFKRDFAKPQTTEQESVEHD